MHFQFLLTRLHHFKINNNTLIIIRNFEAYFYYKYLL